MTTQPKSRVRIARYAHAVELVDWIDLKEVVRQGGTAQGFADWLFLNRKTFNGRQPSTQYSVYLNQCKDRPGWAALNRQRVEESLTRSRESEKRAQEDHDHLLWWSMENVLVARDVAVALAAFCTGQGQMFASANYLTADGEVPSFEVVTGLVALVECLHGKEAELRREDSIHSEERFVEHLRWTQKLARRFMKEMGQRFMLIEGDLRQVTLLLGSVGPYPSARRALKRLSNESEMRHRIFSQPLQTQSPISARARREL